MAIDPHHPLLLGSASPRRAKLLSTAGVPILVATVTIDEAIRPGDCPETYLERVVALKHQAVAKLWDRAQTLSTETARERARCAALLVADTVVVGQGQIMGKPQDDAHACAMIHALNGKEHQVMTRLIIEEFGSREAPRAQTVSTRVWFREVTDAQIDRYVATGEGRDKAGAYAIQGIGSLLVDRIDGSYANVVGLPIAAVVGALQGMGLLGPLPLAGEA